MTDDLLSYGPYRALSKTKLAAKFGTDGGKLRSRKIGGRTVAGIKRLAATAR